MQTREQRNTAVRACRQSAITTNSAVDSMLRAATKGNPEKFLRCWTAEQKAKSK